jgi:hypothetical protein
MMKRSIFMTSILTFVAMFLVIGISDALGQKRRPVLKKPAVARKAVPAARLYSVPAGTTIRSRMDRTINSKTARVGDTFTATITEPVYSAGGVVVVPVGSTLLGRVDLVTPAANKGRPGQIDVRFVQLRLPNGSKRPINASLTELTGGTNVDNEGTATGKKMKNRKVIFIGGGGAGGAVIGGAIGGGKGALIGALLGAGGGFLGDRMTKGAEAEVKSGTEFGVYLNQAFSLPRFVEAID